MAASTTARFIREDGQPDIPPGTGGGGGGAVSSVFGRTGVVVAQVGDYVGSLVTNDSLVPGATVSAALNTLASSGVFSFNGRIGVVLPASGDYASSQITNNSGVTGLSVSNALNTLQSEITGLVTGVSSVFGRSAAVVAVAGDYLPALVGGFVPVADSTARDALPAAIRQIGTTAYIASTDTVNRLIGGTANANWVDVTVGPVSNLVAGLVPALTVGNGVVVANAGGTAVSTALLVDGNVSGTAAIAGTKISPNFGSQNVTTTGNIILGATPAQLGRIRLTLGDLIYGRDTTNLGQFKCLEWGVGGNNNLGIGDGGNTSTQIFGGSVTILNGATSKLTVSGATSTFFTQNITFASTAGGPLAVTQTNTSSGAPLGDATFRAMGTTNANNNGANANIQGGRRSGTGLKGGARLQLNPDDAAFETMVEAVEVTTGQRVVAFAGAANISATQIPANAGDRVAFFWNAGTAPTAAPAGGFTLFATGGNLGLFTPNGTKTTVGAAGGATALPITPTLYIPIQFNNQALQVPAYAQ